MQRGDLLNESVALGTARISLIALENDLLKLAKRLKDLLEVGLRDAEVNVADVEAMEGSAVGTRSGAAFGGARSTVLLGFGERHDNRNALQFLASQLDSLRNRVFLLKLNVADTAEELACCIE